MTDTEMPYLGVECASCGAFIPVIPGFALPPGPLEMIPVDGSGQLTLTCACGHESAYGQDALHIRRVRGTADRTDKSQPES